MTEQQIKVGDEVIATSKTDPQTVIHGKVTAAYNNHAVLLPVGHTRMHGVHYDAYDIVKVDPPIVFGPEAVIRWKDLATRIRSEDGEWRDSKGSKTEAKDADYADAYKNGALDVLDWGLGVER